MHITWIDNRAVYSIQPSLSNELDYTYTFIKILLFTYSIFIIVKNTCLLKKEIEIFFLLLFAERAIIDSILKYQ